MTSSSTEQFFTPQELCVRWKIHPNTLDKLQLPWIWVAPRARRLEATFVLHYERAQRLTTDA